MEEEVLEKFYEYIDEGDKFGDPNISYAACKALSHYVSNCKEITKSGFLESFNAVLLYLVDNSGLGHEMLKYRTSLTLRAVCNFWYHIYTKEISKNQDKEMDEVLIALQKRADNLTQLTYAHSKDKIIKNAKKIWRNDITILTHGYSSIVFNLIKSAAEDGYQLTVYVTEARPENSGEMMRKKLEDYNVAVKLIIDSSVASIMAKVDYVFLGAEAVVENGGIINKVGTFTISL